MFMGFWSDFVWFMIFILIITMGTYGIWTIPHYHLDGKRDTPLMVMKIFTTVIFSLLLFGFGMLIFS